MILKEVDFFAIPCNLGLLLRDARVTDRIAECWGKQRNAKVSVLMVLVNRLFPLLWC